MTIKLNVLNLLEQGHHDEVAWEQELTETERAAVGMPQLWSARDHVVHRTFGRQNIIQMVTATLQHQEVPLVTATLQHQEVPR